MSSYVSYIKNIKNPSKTTGLVKLSLKFKSNLTFSDDFTRKSIKRFKLPFEAGVDLFLDVVEDDIDVATEVFRVDGGVDLNLSLFKRRQRILVFLLLKRRLILVNVCSFFFEFTIVKI